LKNIYLQKVVTLTGIREKINEIRREIVEGGRREARDVYDIYMLSRKAYPLHKFIKKQPRYIQRGLIHWYQSFSRQDLMLGLLDLDIYDKKFNAKKMIIYLEEEIKKFMKEELE
jgi:hypothetical protein